ncbi:septum formation initiator family protein [Brachybacterium sp. YJGR34]|uniref:FtsB family cell division protein n=1 Tax=Brachybacterium sp. YJGR34 TaxID=2059911 RepID=UPI001300A641|nr:septum formation initiator family protein [Brachybacterium sp. YJGR34]
MSSRRPGAPRSARRPVSASGGRGPAARSTARASGPSGAGTSSRTSRGRGPAAASRPRSTPPHAPEEDGPGITITRRTLALVALVVVALAALVPTVNSYVAQRQQLSELQAQVAGQEQDVEELRDQVARWEDPAYVSARARERLLFAMPGETQYRLTDTSGRDVPLTEAEQAAEEAKEGAWFSTLWESVEGASRLTPEDIPDETGSTDEDVPDQDPADDSSDQDDDQ